MGKRQGLPSSNDRVKTDNTAKPLDLRATANQLESFFFLKCMFLPYDILFPIPPLGNTSQRIEKAMHPSKSLCARMARCWIEFLHCVAESDWPAPLMARNRLDWEYHKANVWLNTNDRELVAPQPFPHAGVISLGRRGGPQTQQTWFWNILDMIWKEDATVRAGTCTQRSWIRFLFHC